MNRWCGKLRKSWEYGHFRTVLAALSAHSVSISIGMCQGYSAILLPQLEESDDFTVDTNQASWLASLGAITNPLGSILSGVLAEYVGRKRSIQLSTLPFLVGWIFIGASRGIGSLYVGRLISGIAAGMSPACYTYVGEISTCNFRGIFQALGPVSASLGILITYTLGYFTSWSNIAYVGVFFALLSLIAMELVPESPPYLAKRKKKQESLESLMWLRRSNAIAQSEYDQYFLNAEEMPSETFLKKYVNRSTMLPFLILVGLFFLQEASGIYIMLFYAVDFFKDANSTSNEYVASIIVGVIRLVMSLIAAFLINLVGRKTLSITSSCGMALSMLVIALYSKYYEFNPEENRVFPLLPIVCILLNVMFSMVGMLPIPWILAGELFPLHVRSIMSGVVICIAQTMIFVSVKVYPDMNYYLNFSGTVLIFFVAAVSAIFFIRFLLPETKDKTLEEIEAHFRKTKATSGFDNEGFVFKPETSVGVKEKGLFSVEINA